MNTIRDGLLAIAIDSLVGINPACVIEADRFITAHTEPVYIRKDNSAQGRAIPRWPEYLQVRITLYPKTLQRQFSRFLIFFLDCHCPRLCPPVLPLDPP